MIIFTGDRTTDRIMNIWFDWYEKYTHCENAVENMTDKDMDKLMYEVGMENFVSFVLEEFPEMVNAGYYYDPESTWKMFLSDTKIGYDVEKALEELLGSYIIENVAVSEYVDRDWISEYYNDGDLDFFFTKNPIGKRMYVKDRKALIDAFVDGIGTFQNGYSFGASEFDLVVMSENDDEGHTYDDVKNYIRANSISKNPRYWTVEGIVWNPRLYDGKEIRCIVRIDLEEIARNADLKKR